eukprot:COSAG01_NODE_2425_length_7679_cov_96.031221_3_plen_74_part_00
MHRQHHVHKKPLKSGTVLHAPAVYENAPHICEKPSHEISLRVSCPPLLEPELRAERYLHPMAISISKRTGAGG